MTDPEESTDAIPIPKGSYNLNFDELDENVNPFQSKSKMGRSPPKGGEGEAVNPFKPRSKLGRSPPKEDGIGDGSNSHFEEDVDPFKPRVKLASSPPGGGDIAAEMAAIEAEQPGSNDCPVQQGELDNLASDPSAEVIPACSPVPSGLESQQAERTAEPAPAAAVEDGTGPAPNMGCLSSAPDKGDNAVGAGDGQQNSPPKKKPAGKKNIKKPKSKLKPRPLSQSNPEDVDVQIFDPKPQAPAQEEPTDCRTEEQGAQAGVAEEARVLSVDREDSPLPPPAQDSGLPPDCDLQDAGGPSSLLPEGADPQESVHDFGTAEDGEAPERPNEGFVSALDALSESATMEMMENLGDHLELKDSGVGRESLFVETKESQKTPKASKKKGASASTPSDSSSGVSNEDVTGQATPPGKVKGDQREKHPAARVLQEQVEQDAAPGGPKQYDQDSEDPGDESQFFDAFDDPPALSDSWVDQIQNYTEVEDSAFLSQDSLDRLSWFGSAEADESELRERMPHVAGEVASPSDSGPDVRNSTTIAKRMGLLHSMKAAQCFCPGISPSLCAFCNFTCTFGDSWTSQSRCVIVWPGLFLLSSLTSLS